MDDLGNQLSAWMFRSPLAALALVPGSRCSTISPGQVGEGMFVERIKMMSDYWAGLSPSGYPTHSRPPLYRGRAVSTPEIERAFKRQRHGRAS
jgi:hypothetical protein